MDTAPPDPETALKMHALRRLLARTRARKLGVTAGAGAAAAASLLLGALAAEALLDRLVALPWLARACISLPAIGAAGYLVWREVLRPLLRAPEDYALACEVERSLPAFQTRLIASIQFGSAAEPPASAFVRALIGETAALAAASDFRQVVKTLRLKHSLRLLLLVLAAAGALAWAGRDEAAILVRRALLMPVSFPARTHIARIWNPAKIALGDTLKITVQATGVLPDEGTVLAHGHSGKTDEYKLERDAPGSAGYHAILPNVQEPLTFHIVLNDAASEEQSLAVLAPPAIFGLQCRQIFPAYTKLPPRWRATPDLELLAGSTLEVTATASAALAEATLHLAGPETDVPMSLSAANPREARAKVTIPVQGLAGFSIQLVDRDGIASRDPVTYRIDIVPDHPPTVKFTAPESATERATAAATERIAFEASDDFGVAKIFLHYKINAGEEKTIPFDPGGALPKALARSFDWDLQPLTVEAGKTIDYWIEAFDANDLTGPGRGATEHRTLKIVTPEDMRAELARRMNDALGGLEQLDRSQEALTMKLNSPVPPKAEVHSRP